MIARYSFRYAILDVNDDGVLDLVVAGFTKYGDTPTDPSLYWGADIWTTIDGKPYRVAWGGETATLTIRENDAIMMSATGKDGGDWCVKLNASSNLKPVEPKYSSLTPMLLDDEANYETNYCISRIFSSPDTYYILTYPDGTKEQVNPGDQFPERFNAIVDQYPIKTDIDWKDF